MTKKKERPCLVLNRHLLLLGILIVVVCTPFWVFASPTEDPLFTPRLSFDPVPRKTIATGRLGVNAFANDPNFGSVRNQLLEVQNTLRLKFIRVLFAWNDQVQKSPNAPIDFSFYDDIAKHIPPRVSAIVVLTGVPSWMYQSKNWINNDPRTTFAQSWVRAVATRYGKRRRIAGFEIWNEPNVQENPDNVLLGLDSDPSNYVNLVTQSAHEIKSLTRNKKVISAATTSIIQNYPETLNYNKDLQKAGLENVVDIMNIHFYGSSYELLLLPSGVPEFLKSITKIIWVTEMGAKGVNSQLAYMERSMPFLMELVPQVKRVYQYQFTENTSSDQTYGLKNLTSGFSVSDLYIYLRDRK